MPPIATRLPRPCFPRLSAAAVVCVFPVTALCACTRDGTHASPAPTAVLPPTAAEPSPVASAPAPSRPVRLATEDEPIDRVAFTPDGQRLLTIGRNNLLLAQWSAAPPLYQAMRRNWGTFPLLSPDGRRVVYGQDAPERLFVDEVPSGTRLCSLRRDVRPEALAPKGDVVVAENAFGGGSTLVEVPSCRVLGSFKGSVLLFDPAGDTFLTITRDARVVRSETRTGKRLVQLVDRGAPAWSLDGTSVLVQHETGGALDDARTGARRFVLPSGVTAAAFRPGTGEIAVRDDEGVRLLDGKTGAVRASLGKPPDCMPLNLVFDPTGMRLAIQCEGAHGAVGSIGDKTTWTPLPLLDDEPTFTPDGSMLFGSRSTRELSARELAVWDTRTGQELARVGGAENPVSPARKSAALDAAGRVLAVPTQRGVVLLRLADRRRVFLRVLYDRAPTPEEMVREERPPFPVALADTGFFAGDREAAEQILSHMGAEPRPVARERPTLLAEFLAGPP